MSTLEPRARLASFLGSAILGSVILGFAMVTLPACGGGTRVLEQEPAAAALAEAPGDAFANFKGPRAKAGKTFTLDIQPVLVEDLGLVIRLVKTEWTSYEDAIGKEIREATAVLRLEAGGRGRTLRVDQGSSKSGLGFRVHLVRAREIYNDARATYSAEAEVRVDRDPLRDSEP